MNLTRVERSAAAATSMAGVTLTSSSRRYRPGFTLIELMVATTLSLILILAVTQGFAVVSQTISTNRATLEMVGQLRGVTLRLRKDLDGITVPVTPFLPSSSNRGYVELQDGPSHDLDADANGVMDVLQKWDTSMGDIDDVLMFTTRSTSDERFAGRILGVDRQSLDAEIAWWTRLNDTDGNGLPSIGEHYTVYRRALLIRPDLNGPQGFFAQLPLSGSYSIGGDMQQLYNDIQAFYNENDLSVHFIRIISGGNLQVRIVANSLADLSLRQNRFAHDPLVIFPTPNSPEFRPAPTTPYDLAFGFNNTLMWNYIKQGTHLGEDVMLINVLAFDLRVFDPQAAVSVHVGEDAEYGPSGNDVVQGGWPGTDDFAVSPGDPGFGQARVGGSLFTIGNGAFVDMSYFLKLSLDPTIVPASQFSHPGGNSPPVPATSVRLLGPIYDTWALDYENNGINENAIANAIVDEGVDGLDSNGQQGIDDPLERETFPPYPFELRGIQVRLRILDPDSRQVRQASVVADFSPQ